MFEKIIGNDIIKEQLKKSINNNQISHSYLFVGIEGIGKKMLATELAKAILCLNDNKYCNNCKSCVEFDGNNNPDFLYIEPDGNSLKIEQIREMQKKVVEQPIISKNKVYIIDNADLMTREAQNCLLKTLEEPPEFVTIILIGSNESNFLSTIKSRCTILRFENIEPSKIEKYLKEKFGIQEVPKSIIEAANGSIGKAELLKDKQELYIAIDTVLENIEKMDLIDTLKNADIIYKSQDEKNEILEYINIKFLKKAKENLKYLKCIDIVEETKKRIKANSNYNMSIDNMLISIWEVIN
mgnify:CR=1 FL=1